MTKENNDNQNNVQNTDFQGDLTDGRLPGNWKTRYSEEIAQNAINWEKKYLIILFFVLLIVSFGAGLYFKGYIFSLENIYPLGTFKIYLFAFLGGMLGGTVFSMKWLYHSVAKNTWNIDRRLWRIITPLLSSAIALIVILLLNSGLLNTDSYSSIYKSFSVGFLAGYFSDSAIGKLTEIAQVLFGSTSTKGK
ncbi:MAG: hypothetical protein A2046_08950 [Bacteroidetes bacterium GWA2_30_7]|nr:MAG: hypothetical protein A2046_08950 [Bacteroidetes bacterium GWA2_30_7]